MFNFQFNDCKISFKKAYYFKEFNPDFKNSFSEKLAFIAELGVIEDVSIKASKQKNKEITKLAQLKINDTNRIYNNTNSSSFNMSKEKNKTNIVKGKSISPEKTSKTKLNNNKHNETEMDKEIQKAKLLIGIKSLIK